MRVYEAWGAATPDGWKENRSRFVADAPGILPSIWYPHSWTMGSPQQSMVYLYGLLVLSLAAILWAAWAVTKHVRRQAAEGKDKQEAEELEGAMTRTPGASEDATSEPKTNAAKE